MGRFKLFLISIFLVLCIGNAYGQVAIENQIFEYDNFSGGQNNKLSPFALPKNQGDIVENLRLDSELLSLTKRDGLILYGAADNTEPILGMHRLYLDDGTKVLIVNHGDEIEKAVDSTKTFSQILPLTTGDKRWQWETWHNIAIGTDGYNQPVKYDGTSSSSTYLGSALATDAGEGAGPDGTYSYKISCYSASYEAIFDQASNELTVSDNDIDLTMIPLCPDTILGEDTVGRKVYRTETGGSTYKLLSNGTIADNSTVILTDSDADGALGASYPAGDLSYKPPKGKYNLIHKNRLWIANNPNNPSSVYYSEDGLPDVFLVASVFNVRKSDGDEITGIFNVLGKLTVLKNNTIQKIYTDGDTPSSDWAISDPFSFIGCQAPYSAVNTTVGLIYLGNNGLYAFRGQNSELISDAVTPVIKDILASNFAKVWGTFYKNSYYMAYASISSGESENNRVLILDLVSNAYMTDLMNVNVLDVFDSGSDVEALYSGASDSGDIYAHTETSNEVVHKKHSDFTGTWVDMRYIPTAVGGDANSPVLELAWTQDTGYINNVAGLINNASGIIDRPDTDGTYTSQYLTVGASTFDKIYWNEVIPTLGGDVTFNLRSGATTTDCGAASWWGSEFSDSSGSDISDVTADTVIQYRVTMTTNDITVTPNIILQDNFNVKITFNSVGSGAETSIPIKWRSGWEDFGYPSNAKTLKKLYAFYDWNEETTGTLNLTFENYLGDTDTFAINLYDNPSYYIDYFTDMAFTGNVIRMTIDEDSLNPITIKKVIIVYDVQPITYKFPN